MHFENCTAKKEPKEHKKISILVLSFQVRKAPFGFSQYLVQ